MYKYIFIAFAYHNSHAILVYQAFQAILHYYTVFLFHSDDPHDDDIIFEDFARLRLKGGETEA